ncbi:MAG: YncE family protein [Solirubrobacterales bacterium]|nr:YncE family protein [Solirubrobacterales bacterium]
MKPAPPVTSTRPSIVGRIWTPAILTALAAAATALLGGCGDGSDAAKKPRRAAEPADSPPLHAQPAGTTAKIGNQPEGLVFDSAAGLLAVGLREPDRLAFVEPRSLATRREVALPAAARHLAYSPAEAAVVVPAESANEVLAVSPGAGILSRLAVGRHPHDAAVLGATTFVADEHSDQVSVLRKRALDATLPAPHQPGGIAIAGPYVVLVAVSARVLRVYDAGGLRVLGTARAGVGPSHVVADGTLAYVADTQGDAIRVFRIGVRPREVAEAPLPGTPYGLAVDRRRHRLWVTLTAGNRLAEYATSPAGALRRIAGYPTVRQPNSVEVEPRSGAVLVAGRTSPGEIERIVPSGAAR